MTTYSINLNEAQDLALSCVAVSQEGWIQNAVFDRCRIATDEIVRICVEKCLETGTPIPASKDEMVLLAFNNGWVQSMADAKAAQEAAEAERQLQEKA